MCAKAAGRAMRRWWSTAASTICTTTAITLLRWWDWSASASSAIAIPSPKQYAEHLGIAFQLTNILRDVKEDAAMARVYLPQEDLERFGVTAEELGSGVPMEKLRPLLAFEAARARKFYASADRLLPLIDEVSQPALWAMVEIYRGILDRIERKQFDVYSERVRLSVGDKLKILAKGFGKRLL